MKQALLMAFSILAIGLAVTATSYATDGTSDKFEAARKSCEQSSGITEGKRPTKDQHEAMQKCMKAAGFEGPPHGPPPHVHHRPPPPPDAGGPAGGVGAPGDDGD